MSGFSDLGYFRLVEKRNQRRVPPPLFACRAQNLCLQRRRNEEVSFVAEESHLRLDGGNLPSALGTQQDTHDTCDSEAGLRGQLAPLLFVNEDEVRIEIRRQGNRLGLS